jgi:ATP-dependent exoDNAse (exonuclease V) beta subunit
VASRLVRHDEIDEAGDLRPIADAAVAAYMSICARDDIRTLYQSGRRLHEVPFTMTRDGRVLRGTVDCLVERAPRQFTILEFKTGRPRPEHRAQLDLYVQAMKQAFPGTLIDARLVYS